MKAPVSLVIDRVWTKEVLLCWCLLPSEALQAKGLLTCCHKEEAACYPLETASIWSMWTMP